MYGLNEEQTALVERRASKPPVVMLRHGFADGSFDVYAIPLAKITAATISFVINEARIDEDISETGSRWPSFGTSDDGSHHAAAVNELLLLTGNPEYMIRTPTIKLNEFNVFAQIDLTDE